MLQVSSLVILYYWINVTDPLYFMGYGIPYVYVEGSFCRLRLQHVPLLPAPAAAPTVLVYVRSTRIIQCVRARIYLGDPTEPDELA